MNIKKIYNELQENILSIKYSIYIENFKNILYENLPHCDLTLLENNIKTLKFEYLNKKVSREENSLAKYSIKKNKIYLSKIKDKNIFLIAIIHELLHMASSIKIGNLSISGFQYQKGNKIMGIGINEGYTSLILNKYFIKNSYYELETFLVYFLEKIIGKEKMEQLYFLGGIEKIIIELKKYNTINNICKFISYMDIINMKDLNEIYEELKYIIDFLLNTYINKLDKDLKQNIIDYETYLRLKKEYIDEIGNVKITEKLIRKEYNSETIILRKDKNKKIS